MLGDNQRINTARLCHAKRALIEPGLCSACAGPYSEDDHWYVRFAIREGMEKDAHVRRGLETACGEACARSIYGTCLAEIALVTGEKPKNLSHKEERAKESAPKRRRNAVDLPVGDEN